MDTIETSKHLMEESFVEGSFNIIKYRNGTREVSLVVRCPLFRGVLSKGFHCILKLTMDYHSMIIIDLTKKLTEN